MSYANLMCHDDGGVWDGEEWPGGREGIGDAGPWSDDPVTFCHNGVIRQTAMAVQYRFGDREVWLPRSKTSEADGAVTMPKWMANRNGLWA